MILDHTIYRMGSLQEVESLTDFSTPMAYDTETIGFYGKIRLAQFYQPHWDQVILVEYPNDLALISLLSRMTFYCHNAHYDITTSQAQSQLVWVPEKFEDTFLAARLAMPMYDTYTLDDCMARVLGFDPYVEANLDKKTLQKSKWNKPQLDKEQKLYASIDVYCLPKLFEAVSKAFTMPAYILDKKTLRTCLEVQWNGVPIHETNLQAKKEETIKKLGELAELTPVGKETRWLMKTDKGLINVNSYKQVRELLNSNASDDAYLSEREMDGCEYAKNIRTVRTLTKRLSTIYKYEEKGEKLYGKLKPSARSGRLTSDDENLQQIPRALKGLFGMEEGDGVLIFADYAQLELRTICAILGVSKMEELFRAGADLHSYTADMLFGKDWKETKPLARLYSKGANFGLLYGGGIEMFIGFMMQIASVKLEYSEASDIRKGWRTLWREIFKWQQEGISKWQKGKLGHTPLGRYYKAKMMTDFLNIENQGAGADVAKLAFIRLNERVAELRTKYNLRDDEMCLVNFVHDSYIIAYYGNDEEVYKEAAHVMAQEMQKAWFEMSKIFKIKDLPMPVDVRVGYDWKSIDSDDGFKLYQYELEGMAMLEEVLNG